MPAALLTLVRSMTEAQQLAFERAMVAQAIRAVSRLPPPIEQDDGHRKGIAAAERWLADPSPAVAKDTTEFAAGECWDGGARHDDYPIECLDAAWAAGELDPCKAAAFAANATPEPKRAAVLA